MFLGDRVAGAAVTAQGDNLLLDIFRQVEQGQELLPAPLADAGQFFHRFPLRLRAEGLLIFQESPGFVDGTEVLTLQVLHQLNCQAVTIGHIPNDAGDVILAGNLRGAVAPFPADNAEIVFCFDILNLDRLAHPMLADRLGQFLQRRRIEAGAGLVGIRLDLLQGQFPRALESPALPFQAANRGGAAVVESLIGFGLGDGLLGFFQEGFFGHDQKSSFTNIRKASACSDAGL